MTSLRRMIGIVALAIAGLAIAGAAGASAQVGSPPECDPAIPTVGIASGSVCGITRTGTQGHRSAAYLGIPFAEAPVGALRWKPPVARASLGTAPFRATRYGAQCVQPGPGSTGVTGSEDCLSLNVYRPAGPQQSGLPVLVYIHGGGFLVTQSNEELDGSALASQGTVVVTFNYRMGVFGFLRYTDRRAGIAGNFAIQDQQLALKWVRDNISAFGGDPSKVTLFGESAGAMSVGFHLFTAPSSTSLFQAAAMESNLMGLKYSTASQAAGVGRSYVNLLCRSYVSGRCPATGAWLRSLTAEQVAQGAGLTYPPGGMPGLMTLAIENRGGVEADWAPTVGVAPLTNRQPIDGYGPGSRPKPFIFGVNATEGAFFLPSPSTLTPSQYMTIVRRAFGAAGAERIVNYSEGGRRIYDPYAYRPRPQGGLTRASRALARLQTDFIAGAANMKMAATVRRQAPGTRMFGYHFTFRSSFDFTGLQRCTYAALTTCHTDEIPYVWSQLVEKDQFGLTVPVKAPTQSELRLAAQMSSAWAGFAKDPSKGMGFAPLRDPLKGGYVIWNDPVSVGRLMPVSRYALWEPFLP